MMQITVDIETIVGEIVADPEVCMDLLGACAERGERQANRIAAENCGSIYHSRVAPWLRQLADLLDQQEATR